MSIDRPEAPDPIALLPPRPEFALTSDELVDGAELPLRHAHPGVGGQGVSPHLRWSGFPERTMGFALTCFDPDAPTGCGFWHWVMVDLPATVTSLAGGAQPPDGAFCVRNDYGTREYGGAAPPAGDRRHRYLFVVHAVDVARLGPGPEASPAAVGFHLAFHTLGRAVLRSTFAVGPGD